MNRSPSNLPEADRKSVCAALNAALVDALEFYGQLKLAHWNVRGPHFMSYHQLFEELATTVQDHSDEVAERISTLGAKVQGTSKYVAANTTLPEYEAATEKDLEHVWKLASRLDALLATLRAALATSDKAKDVVSSNLLLGVLQEVEKRGWFLRATLGQ